MSYSGARRREAGSRAPRSHVAGAPPQDQGGSTSATAHHRTAATPIGTALGGSDESTKVRRAAPPTLPVILCYHKIDPRLELGVTRLSPKRFARQIERLAGRGWSTLTLDELLACARGERAVGARELAITFDDAYRALRTHAFPVLESLGFTAICSVITDYAGKLNRWERKQEVQLMSLSKLIKME